MATKKSKEKDVTVVEPMTFTIEHKEVKKEVNEEDYLNSLESLPFSTSLRADLYLKLKRVEYHNRLTIKEILESLLEAYMSKQPASKEELPAKEANKLKALKTAKDYNKLRLEKIK